MKKLKLRLEELRIDSFATSPAEKAKGTVFGEQCSCQGDCVFLATGDGSCDGTCDTIACGTEDISCGDSCYECTCVASCEGQTCGDYTCRGWNTFGGGPIQVCAICD